MAVRICAYLPAGRAYGLWVAVPTAATQVVPNPEFLRPQLHELFAPINELGWVSDGALGLAVRAAVARIPRTCPAVVLENLPGDVFQVADIYLAVRERGGRLLVIHLDSEDDILITRGSGRRACQTCEHDTSADPHEPAQPSLDDRRLCARCASPLTVRPNDEHVVLRERTTRHRRYTRGVLRTIEALDIPLVRIDATKQESTVEQLALAEIDARMVIASQGA
jgi:adenylate kinase family enzyme